MSFPSWPSWDPLAPGGVTGPQAGTARVWQGTNRQREQALDHYTAQGPGAAPGCAWHGSASDTLAGAPSARQPPGSSPSFSLFPRCAPGADSAWCPPEPLPGCGWSQNWLVFCQGQDFRGHSGWSWDGAPRGVLPVPLSRGDLHPASSCSLSPCQSSWCPGSVQDSLSLALSLSSASLPQHFCLWALLYCWPSLSPPRSLLFNHIPPPHSSPQAAVDSC